MTTQTPETIRKALAVLTIALTAALALIGLPGSIRADTSFPQTGATIWGPFETYWNEHGGLAQFGMPRTGVYPSKDGTYDAQWFERALFTYNPNNPDPYKVQLQLIGSIVTANRTAEPPFQRKPPMANPASQYFEATGHNLIGKFLEYWKSHGGLPIYGYPISEQFVEKSKSDGKDYLVQYFERNRLELHPELAGTPYEVQLGLLGSELLDAQGGPAAFANLGAPHFYPPQGGVAATPTPASTYPKMGHAPDYSWISGQVQFTRIQGGCTYIQADDARYVPGGAGWDAAAFHNGDYVVLFGHTARQGEPFPLCPGGIPYSVESAIANP